MNDNNDNSEYEKEKKGLIIRHIIITIIVALVVAVFSSEFTMIYYFNKGLKKSDASEDPKKTIKAIGETLENFRTVIDNLYIGEIDEQKLLDETVKGYVNGLGDEYSQYFTAKEWEEFQTQALGNYVGIGIYMGVDTNGNIVVVSPIKDSPAEKAGLKKGDIIIRVNDEEVLGVSSDVVSSKIKGEAGTKVKITVFREEENDYLDFEVVREEIKIYHVEGRMLDNKIGYILLYTFDEGCSEEFRGEYELLKSQGAEKFIIDLRDNTGGLVDEALDIIDMFLPKNETMLITKDTKESEKETKSKEDQYITEKDIVFLVNGYSASASEIVVGALKDHSRAKIVGTKTYGKGVIQSVFMLDDNSALKLTTSEYFTPNRNQINKIGIEPDEVIELDKNSEEDNQLNKAIELLK